MHQWPIKSFFFCSLLTVLPILCFKTISANMSSQSFLKSWSTCNRIRPACYQHWSPHQIEGSLNSLNPEDIHSFIHSSFLWSIHIIPALDAPSIITPKRIPSIFTSIEYSTPSYRPSECFRYSPSSSGSSRFQGLLELSNILSYLWT